MGLASHYRHMLKGKGALGGAEDLGPEGLESTSRGGRTSDARVEEARDQLYRIVKEYLGDESDLYAVADQIAENGKGALQALDSGDEEKLAQERTLSALEVIVRTDGSRPSFMVINGVPDSRTSPVGEWADELEASADLLQEAVASVGRVDDPSSAQGFQGTGILIGDDLIMTNRHVLQAICADPNPSDGWQLNPDVAIDFGHEFRGRKSVGRRKIKSVVFAGKQYIDPFAIDLGKLDLALLSLEPTSSADAPKPLKLDKAPDWGQAETGIYICGYPGNPGIASNPPSLLELLFKMTYGCKRLAPGIITTVAETLPNSPQQWALGHDATTLGGNSGSAVLVMGREGVTAGLHFGGRLSDPRENWCHVLGRTLEETDGRSSKTLQNVLDDWGVEVVDRFQSA
jgi:V8-like Glu-specific endopeptidase